MSYSFTITNDAFGLISSMGHSSQQDFSVYFYELEIPTNNIGLPTNMQNLLSLVGKENLSYTISIQAAGHVTSTQGIGKSYLKVQGEMIPEIGGSKYKTSDVTLHEHRGHSTDFNSGYLQIYTGSDILSDIHIYSDTEGSITKNAKWENIKIGLMMEVSVNMFNFCTTPDSTNINLTPCYNFMVDYIASEWKNSGPPEQLTTYLQNYCSKKYPNGQLDLFYGNTIMTKRDQDICACNMPSEEYQTFYAGIKNAYPDIAIGDIPAKCLFAPCGGNSNFRGHDTKNCPLPQCFNDVTIRGSNISGPVNVKQSAKCKNLVSGNNNGGNNGNSTSFWKEYEIPIVITIVLLIIIVIAIIIFVIIRSRKNQIAQ